MHLVWKDAYPLAIYVHILEIRWVKQLVQGVWNKSEGDSSTHTALIVVYPKKYNYKSLVYLK
jgi:hypothetical protein